MLRFCLKVMGQLENDMILGTSQYKAGIRATMFAFDDKGVLLLRRRGPAARGSCAARTSTGPTAKVIVARARVMREAAGRLTGYALGEDGDQEVRSFAADVLMVFGADDKLWCETIAARLAGSIPSAYADITKDAVASQLRALEVDVKSVRETGKGPRSGCERAAVAAAAPPRRSVAEAPGCVALPQHALTWPDTRRAATAATPPPGRDLRCCGVAAELADPLNRDPMEGRADELATATQRRLRPVREAARPDARVRVEQPPQADRQAAAVVRHLPQLPQALPGQPARARLRAEIRLPAGARPRTRSSSATRPARSGSSRAHDYTACADNDCKRALCVAYKTGWKAGDEAGYDRGWQQGHEAGFKEGYAEGLPGRDRRLPARPQVGRQQ